MTQQLFQCSNKECGKFFPAEEMKAPYFSHSNYFDDDERFQINLAESVLCKACSEDYGAADDDEFHYPLMEVIKRREDEKKTVVLNLGWKDFGEDDRAVHYCLEIHPKGLRLRGHRNTYFNESEQSESKPLYSSKEFVAKFIAEFLASITKEIDHKEVVRKQLLVALVASTNFTMPTAG